jgi:hypothetical protein
MEFLMALRFTCSDKWKKSWFRNLSPINKCFWIYLLDNCNHAGIWDVDFELASFQIGKSLNVSEIREKFSEKIIEIEENKKWYIVDFIEFQYKCSIIELNEKNKVHKSVLNILNKYNIKGLARGLQGAMVAPKDKDKDKDKEKDKETFLEFVKLTAEEHKKLTEKYGTHQRDILIERLNNYIGSKGKKYKSHYFTILSWANKENIDPDQKKINDLRERLKNG